jgi:hypothetical protein
MQMDIWFFSVVSRSEISDSGEEVSSCGYGLRIFIENRTHQSLWILSLIEAAGIFFHGLIKN